MTTKRLARCQRRLEMGRDIGMERRDICFFQGIDTPLVELDSTAWACDTEAEQFPTLRHHRRLPYTLAYVRKAEGGRCVVCRWIREQISAFDPVRDPQTQIADNRRQHVDVLGESGYPLPCATIARW